MDTKQLIKQIIANYDSDIDTSEGSGITDILINPLSNVLEYYQKLLEKTQNLNAITDPKSLSTEDLDALGSTYLLDRREGNKSTGYVKIAFATAQNIIIPKNQQFKTTDGKIFVATRQYSITSSQMSQNIENNYYITGNIPVEAIEAGEEYTLAPYEINEIVNATFNYLKVYNPSNFSKGSDTETNEEFYERLVESVTSDTGLSKLSFKKVISNHYAIKDLDVKGFGDVEMVRDINYSGIDFQGYKKLDFFGKRQGYATLPHNQNIGGAFILSGSEPPVFTNLTINEFEDTQYQGMYRLDDALYTNSLSSNIVDDDFSASELDSNWLTSDADLGYEKLKVPEEIGLTAGSVRLGLSQTTEPDIQVVLSQNEINGIITQITKTISKVAEEQEATRDV